MSFRISDELKKMDPLHEVISVTRIGIMRSFLPLYFKAPKRWRQIP